MCGKSRHRRFFINYAGCAVRPRETPLGTRCFHDGYVMHRRTDGRTDGLRWRVESRGESSLASLGRVERGRREGRPIDIPVCLAREREGGGEAALWRPRPPCYTPSLSFSFELALQLRFLLPHPPSLPGLLPLPSSPLEPPSQSAFPHSATADDDCDGDAGVVSDADFGLRVSPDRSCPLLTRSLNAKQADAWHPSAFPPPFIPPSLPSSLRQTVRQHSHLPLPNTNDAVGREGGGRETGVGRGRGGGLLRTKWSPMRPYEKRRE